MAAYRCHAAGWLRIIGDMPEIDDVLRALADPNRRLLLERLNARNGQSLWELCGALSMQDPRPTRV